MQYKIELACDSVQKAIDELRSAAAKAKEAGDRMAERNLGEDYQIRDLTQILRNLKSHVEYITQPRFAKYFNQETTNKEE